MNRSLRKLFIFIALIPVAALSATGVFAGDWKVVDDDDWCRTNRKIKYCEVREITLDAWDDVRVKTINGTVSVQGWDRDEIRIRARIQVRDMSRKKAERLVERIDISTGVGGIEADGPENRRFFGLSKNKKWSVAYDIMVPNNSRIAANSVNGRIDIREVFGDIDFETVNGRVSVRNAGADVSGGTVNGRIDVSLITEGWQGDEIDVSTTNGGVEIELPDDFSADIDAKTLNGGIRVDQAMTIEKKSRRRLRGRIGDGGTLIKVRTLNGGVSLSRAR